MRHLALPLALLLAVPVLAKEKASVPSGSRAEHWLSRLESGDLYAIDNLVALGTDAVSPLVKAVKAKPEGKLRFDAWNAAMRRRMLAILALGEVGEPEGSDALAVLAADPKEVMAHRSAAALALGRMRKVTPEAVGTLRALLRGKALEAEERWVRNASTPAIVPDYVRRISALALGRLKAKEAAEDLWIVASAPASSAELKVAALLGLAEIGDPAYAAKILPGIRSLEAERKDLAQVQKRADAEFVLEGLLQAAGTCAKRTAGLDTQVLGILRDPKAPVTLRQAAAVALGMAGRAETAKSMEPLLRDRSSEVQIETAIALGGLQPGHPAALDLLLAGIKDRRSPIGQAHAAIGLGNFADAKVIPALDHAVVRDPDNLVKLNAVNAAGNLPSLAETNRLLKEALSARDEGVRAEAVGYLWERPIAGEILKLLLGLSEPDKEPSEYVRQRVAIALDNAGGAGVEGLLDDPAPKVRREAALTAGVTNRAAARKALEKLLTDEFDTVRKAAREALSSLDTGKLSGWMIGELDYRKQHLTGPTPGHEWRRLRDGLSDRVLQVSAADLEERRQILERVQQAAQQGGAPPTQEELDKIQALYDAVPKTAYWSTCGGSHTPVKYEVPDTTSEQYKVYQKYSSEIYRKYEVGSGPVPRYDVGWGPEDPRMDLDPYMERRAYLNSRPKTAAEEDRSYKVGEAKP